MTRNQPATKLPWKDLSPATEMQRSHLRETNLAYAVHAINAYQKLVAAVQRSTPSACQATSPGSPNYAGGRECGKCAYCSNTALLRELGEAK